MIIYDEDGLIIKKGEHPFVNNDIDEYAVFIYGCSFLMDNRAHGFMMKVKKKMTMKEELF